MNPQGSLYKNYDLSQPFSLILNRPRAPRWGAPFKVGDRTADFRRLFAFWIDLVEDPDISSRRDPNIHVRMMRDPQIYAAFTVRALATASLPWHVKPTGDTPEALGYAKKISSMLETLPNFAKILKNIMLAIPMGMSVNEVVWMMNGGLEVAPHDLYPVHKDRFVFDLDGNLAIRSPVDIFWGEAVPKRTFIRHTFDQLPGSFLSPLDEARLLFGFGLNDVLYPTWFAKQIILRMDLRYLERFGTPTRVGRYPRRNIQARDALEELINDLARDQVALFPSDEGYDLDFLEASGGGHTAFSGMIQYFDRLISKAYLGSTLLLETSGGGGRGGGGAGSYSLGRIQERSTFGRIVEYDHQGVASLLNKSLIQWVFELNGWPPQYMPSFEFTRKESHDINELIEALRVAQSMGFVVTAEMLTEQTGFRAAKKGETILQVDAGTGEVNQTAGIDILGQKARQGFVDQMGGLSEQTMDMQQQLDEMLQAIGSLSTQNLIAA